MLITYYLLQIGEGDCTNLTGTIWCDNKSAIQIYNDLEGELPYSLKAANQTDADVLKELRYWKNKLPSGIIAAWVKSHQARCTTKEARLNRIVDHLASKQHDVEGYWATTQRSTMLPLTKAQLIYKGNRHTSVIDKKIQYEHYNTDAKQYVIEKLDLHQAERFVDWKSIGRHNRTLSWHRRATRAKFVFRWAPTNKRLFEIKLA